jgi:hypothetical protein
MPPTVGGSVGETTLELAYDAALDSLKMQEARLSGLRSRATGVLSAAALVTGFSTGLGLINTNPKMGVVFPKWAALALLAVLVAIGALDMVVLWPAQRWQFGPDVREMLCKHDGGTTVDDIRRYVIDDALDGVKCNYEHLNLRFRCYQWSAGLLVGEVIILVTALVSAQS